MELECAGADDDLTIRPSLISGKTEMPIVKIRIYAPLTQQLGVETGSGPVSLEFTLESGDGMRELFQKMGERFPLFWKTLFDQINDSLAPNVILIVNGTKVNLEEAWKMSLSREMEVVLLPSLAGG